MSHQTLRNRFRLEGGGRRTPFAQMEAMLFSWIKEQRANKRLVSYTSLRNKSIALRNELGDIAQFRASPSWLRAFLERHNLSYQ